MKAGTSHFCFIVTFLIIIIIGLAYLCFIPLVQAQSGLKAVKIAPETGIKQDASKAGDCPNLCPLGKKRGKDCSCVSVLTNKPDVTQTECKKIKCPDGTPSRFIRRTKHIPSGMSFLESSNVTNVKRKGSTQDSIISTRCSCDATAEGGK